MQARAKTAVLMFALGLACAASGAGKGGSSATTARSGETAAGRPPPSASSVPVGGSNRRAGGGMYGAYAAAPKLDPKRKISEQDCTRPIVHDGGNLRCK